MKKSHSTKRASTKNWKRDIESEASHGSMAQFWTNGSSTFGMGINVGGGQKLKDVRSQTFRDFLKGLLIFSA